MKIIKRYANRKLYDMERHHYVTLAGVAELVRQGVDVQVVDYVTSADLTAQTLAQAIYEEELRRFESKQPPRVEVAVLQEVVREGISATT